MQEEVETSIYDAVAGIAEGIITHESLLIGLRSLQFYFHIQSIYMRKMRMMRMKEKQARFRCLEPSRVASHQILLRRNEKTS